MQQVALSWLAYHLTNSAFFLGMVSFAGQIPALLVMPIAGVIADRFNKHKIIIITQFLAMFQAFILFYLVFSGNIQNWHIITLNLFIGFINGFDIPTRHSFINELVSSKNDLPNAIALNSMIFNTARFVGPSIAGVIIAVAGEGVCFLINALSYLAVLGALLKITPATLANKTAKSSYIKEIINGVDYAYKSVPIRSLLLLLAVISLVVMPYSIIMPIFAKDILKGGPQTLGWLMAAIGAGAFCGAIMLASKKTVFGLEKFLVIAVGLFAFGILVFSFSTMIWLSLMLLLVAGFGMMVQNASINTILQSIVDDDKRGRIMSLYAMAFLGTAPFGSFLAGLAAQHFGAPITLRIAAAVSIISGIIFWRKLPIITKHIHPIYQQKGIVPQLAQAVDSASYNSVQIKE